jgi:hypothetical protein
VDWYEYFLQQSGQKIIQKWLDNCESAYPNQHNLSGFHRNGTAYLVLLTDIRMPFEEHPSFEFVSLMCKDYAKKQISMQYLLHTLHIWRESILEYIWSYCDDKNIPVNEMKRVVPFLHLRADNFQHL